jgi:hypothetical protein
VRGKAGRAEELSFTFSFIYAVEEDESLLNLGPKFKKIAKISEILNKNLIILNHRSFVLAQVPCFGRKPLKIK